MSKGKRIDGELYWPFRCAQGHEFDLGPIHDPESSETDPGNPEMRRSVAGSGKPEHVPDTAPCWPCRKEGDRNIAHRVD